MAEKYLFIFLLQNCVQKCLVWIRPMDEQFDNLNNNSIIFLWHSMIIYKFNAQETWQNINIIWQKCDKCLKLQNLSQITSGIVSKICKSYRRSNICQDEWSDCFYYCNVETKWSILVIWMWTKKSHISVGEMFKYNETRL